MRKRREVKVNGRAILTIALVVMLVVSFILAAVKINRETEKYCVNALDDAVKGEVKVNGRAILTIALVVMLVVSFILAAVKINRETEKYCVNALDDAVKGLANDIKVDMGDYLEQIESIANAIGTYGGASYEDYAMLLSSYCSGLQMT